MEQNKFHLVYFKDFLQGSVEIANQIIQDNKKYDLVIPINRGGLVLGRLLSDFLGVRMGSFAMSSYIGVNEKKELEITQNLNIDIKTKKVLLVDDVSDSGETFIVGKEYLESKEPAVVETAALFYKPKTEYIPNYVYCELDKWLIFPYEIKETWQQLGQNQADFLYQYYKDLGLDKKSLERILE